MTKIVQMELSSTSNYIIDKMNTINDRNSRICNSINNFIANSKAMLKGNAYDTIRTRLGILSDMLASLSPLNEEFNNGIKSANEGVAEYMEDYDVLDDKDLPELKARFNELISAKNQLEAEINSYIDLRKNRDPYSYYKEVDLSELQSRLTELNVEILEIKRKIAKLEGLNGADAEGFSKYKYINSKYLAIENIINSNSGAYVDNNTYYEPNATTCYNDYFSTELFFYSQAGIYDGNGKLIDDPTSSQSAKKSLNTWLDTAGGEDVDVNIIEAGCSITSYAAVLSSMLGRPVSPEDVAMFLQKNGYKNGGFYESFTNENSEDFGINAMWYSKSEKIGDDYTGNQVGNTYISEHKGTKKIDAINDTLNNGGSVMVAVEYNGTKAMHWVSVLGIDNSTNPPTYIVNDPYSTDPYAERKWQYDGYSFNPEGNNKYGEMSDQIILFNTNEPKYSISSKSEQHIKVGYSEDDQTDI